MPITKLQFKPGFHSENADYTEGPTWIKGQWVRFWKTFPEKIGGWQRQTSNTFLGIARDIIAWRTIAQADSIGLGTHKKLYVSQSDTYFDITPQRTLDPTGTLSANPFYMTNTSANVTITDTGHAALAGDYVIFAGAAASAGITINGEYEIKSITDSNAYVITHSASANSTGSGGGSSVTYEYLLETGDVDTTYGLGWGAGQWNQSTWGTARAKSSIFYYLTRWSLTNWGEDLIANRAGGLIYLWDASAGSIVRSTALSNAPKSNYVLVSSDRHLISFGSSAVSASGDVNPLQIRWSNQEDNNTWAPVSTNTAGDKLLEGSTRIMTAVETRKEIVIITDEKAHSMRFAGPPFTFVFQEVGSNCGAISPHCAIDVNSVVYWMGTDNFFMYDGTLKVLNCSVHSEIFDDMEFLAAEKTFAGVNQKFNEIWWLYTTDAATENDVYVIYNYVEKTWVTGTLVRTVWLDSTEGAGQYPLAADASGVLYEHEKGVDDVSSALAANIESGKFELGDGDRLVFMDKYIFDGSITGNLLLTLLTRRYPASTEVSKGPYTMTSSTEKVSLRARGRQFAIKLSNTGATGATWRAGTQRVNIKPSGRR